jgi:hypothetical protein
MRSTVVGATMLLLSLVAVAERPPRADVRSEACAFPAPPMVVRDEVGALLQYWLIRNAPELGESSLPATPSLHEFRERIARSIDTVPRSLVERQLAGTTGADAENVRLVLAGAAGSIRPMSCLEALLLATRTERATARGRPMHVDPTEFVSFVLKRGDTLKVWFYTVDQPGLGRLGVLHEPVGRDVDEGWEVVTNLHNHNFFPGTERVLGGVVPSGTDVQYLRSARATFGLPGASITNGFHSLDISAGDLDRFAGP